MALSHEPVDEGNGGGVKEMMAVDRNMTGRDRTGADACRDWMEVTRQEEPEGGVAIWSGSRRKVQVSRTRCPAISGDGDS